MKVLVVGAMGFIGSHLVRYLSDKYDVFTADVAGTPSERHHVLRPDAEGYDAVLAAVQPDVCVNCSGAANVGQSFQDPAHDFQLNVVVVQRWLEAIRRHTPHTRFLNLSSAAVYGNPATIPIAESSPFLPISPYGCHKVAAESLCREYAVCFGQKTQSFRVFSVFGPGLRKQLFWDVFQKSRGATSIVCPGTGNETRDFIYVSDMVRAIHNCIMQGPFDGGVINVGNGEGITIRHALTTLLAAIGWSGELSFNGVVRDGDPLFWAADISRLRAIGYESAFDFETGINELATWLKTLP